MQNPGRLRDILIRMRIIAGALLFLTLSWAAHAQTIDVNERLKGFDE